MSDDFEIDLTPETHMLIGLHSTSLGWKKCLGELIDNAFDAKCTAVRIAFGNKSLVVEDDGVGCSDVDAFFTQGKHRSRNGLGRFGVGLKDAAAWLWGTTEVTSFAKDGGVKCSVNWRKLTDSREWKAVAQRVPAAAETGTRITFSGIARKTPSESLFDELGYTFFPAIESGRQILIRRGNKRPVPVPAFQFPPLDNIVEHSSDINGKEFRVHAGIVQDGHDNPHPGFTIAYKHRVITTTADGCGSYGTARFVGVVHLGEQWKLSRNKDELVEDASLLAETLHLICKDVLIGAADKSRIVTLAGIEQAIASNLHDALLAHKKAKRGSGEKQGTVTPKSTPRTHKQAEKTQPGQKRLMSKIGSRIAVEFVPGLKEIGRASFNEDGTLISLSLHNPYVEWAKDHSDTNALTALAATILAIEAANVTDEKQRHRLLPEIDDEDIRDRFLSGLNLYTSQVNAESAK